MVACFSHPSECAGYQIGDGVATLGLVELSLAVSGLRELAFVDMPNLEQWDVCQNLNLKLATGFGGIAGKDWLVRHVSHQNGQDSGWQIHNGL